MKDQLLKELLENIQNSLTNIKKSNLDPQEYKQLEDRFNELYKIVRLGNGQPSLIDTVKELSGNVAQLELRIDNLEKLVGAKLESYEISMSARMREINSSVTSINVKLDGYEKKYQKKKNRRANLKEKVFFVVFSVIISASVFILRDYIRQEFWINKEDVNMVQEIKMDDS